MKRLIVSVLMLMAATLIFSQRSVDKKVAKSNLDEIHLEQMQGK
ncbi:hypothetical protein [Mangrovimonas futianensis]|nr:hypothetical protein [Mangrovimonas futianensis]